MLKRIMDLLDKSSSFIAWMSLIFFILYSGNKNNVFFILSFICIPVCIIIRIITFAYAIVVFHKL